MPLPSRVAVLLPEYDYIVEHVSRAHAEQLLRRRQAKLEPGGRVIRLIVYHEMPEHPCRTHISSGGPLAAMGMSQIYTRSNERGIVDGFKRIYPEDRACFHQATNPRGWIMAPISLAAAAFSILREAAVFC